MVDEHLKNLTAALDALLSLVQKTDGKANGEILARLHTQSQTVLRALNNVLGEQHDRVTDANGATVALFGLGHKPAITQELLERVLFELVRLIHSRLQPHLRRYAEGRAIDFDDFMLAVEFVRLQTERLLVITDSMSAVTTTTSFPQMSAPVGVESEDSRRYVTS